MRLKRWGAEGHQSLNDDRDLDGFLKSVKRKSISQKAWRRLGVSAVLYLLFVSAALAFMWLAIDGN